jgi:oxygen-independent coproporphyrinogen-3 oxidase
MKKIGIYVHIPFCARKCNYCDFYSVGWKEDIENKYIDSVINEIKGYDDLNYGADTIYFGGGTPTIIQTRNLERIMDQLKETFSVCEDSEISMEANPNTLTVEKLKKYRDMGINRLSIGVQSLNDGILKEIGRIHNSSEAIQAIDNAMVAGFTNINADVMFNIPGQSVEDIEDTLNRIISKKVTHISFYSLKLEKGTKMYAYEKNGTVVMPDEDLEREMYYAGRRVMKESALMQYEISNFSLKGLECKHNLKYWNQNEYIGFGPSAHSFLGRKRFSNPPDLKNYCSSLKNGTIDRCVQEVLNDDSFIFEYIMLKLRLTEGLNFKEFYEKFLVDFRVRYKSQIDFLKKNSLVEIGDECVFLTERGMDISNFVFQQFM